MLALVLLAATGVLWQDPGRVESIDFSKMDVPPKAPYLFVQEDMGGTSPKVLVQDATGIQWRVKGGRDVQPEAFITRFVRALGYYGETTYFFAEGRIEKVPELKRASSFIKPDGSFTWASFEKIEPNAK